MRRKPTNLSPARKLALFIIALIALYGGYYWGNRHVPINQGLQLIHLLQAPQKITPFELTGPGNTPFTAADLTGHWSLLFLGYTGDESDSPHQLTLATRILNRLAVQPEIQSSTDFILLTVDPLRDNHKKLASFVGHYSTDFIALTGEDQQIRGLASQLGMKYRQQMGENGGYRIIHSSSMALINPRGELVGLFTGRVDASNIASDIQQLADSYQ
ncbi:MAG: SCO family protein [Candidatus Sedimenticola sp. (ex Thyasira tokunagai)]